MMLKTIRDLADDNTTISSTRWAFATVILFDIVVIALSLLIFVYMCSFYRHFPKVGFSHSTSYIMDVGHEI